MTMLNGEPVDTGVPHTSPNAATNTVGAKPGSPPTQFRGAPTIAAQGVDPSNRSIAKIMAIVGLILAFTVPPMGIIMGGIAGAMLKPEKSALAKWAVIVGIVFTILGILITIGFFVFTWWITTAAICIDGEIINEATGVPICN